jgi:hypothetical protein
MSFWMTRYRKLSGSKLSRCTPIRFMRWVLVFPYQQNDREGNSSLHGRAEISSNIVHY